MTPHPLATWVQISVATRREVQRGHRRRALRVLLARRQERASAPDRHAGSPVAQPTARIPEQRRPLVVPPASR